MKKEFFLNDNGDVVAIETKDAIHGLFGKFRPLSNFHVEDLIVDDMLFHCSEAAYMAQKTHNLNEKKALQPLVGGAAKRFGQKITLREDWEEVKVDAMMKVVRAKFQQSKFCRDLLLSTGDKLIVESNWWGDDFWGICSSFGQNNLGKILMSIREELRN